VIAMMMNAWEAGPVETDIICGERNIRDRYTKYAWHCMLIMTRPDPFYEEPSSLNALLCMSIRRLP
jgi:hypothetical protein